MAVASPITPNLSGAYANIQEALKQGAQIASTPVGPMAAAAAITTPLAENAQKQRDLMLKATLEDRLAQNKAQYTAEAEGRTLTTPDDFSKLEKTMNLTPGTLAGAVPDKGVRMKPEEKYAIANELAQEKSRQDTKTQVLNNQGTQQADLFDFLSRDKNNAQAAMQVAAGTKIDWIKDDATGYHIAVNHFTHQPIPGMQPLELMGGTLSPTDGTVKLTDWTKLDPVTKKQIQPVIAKSVSDPDINKDINKLYQIQQIRDAANSDNPTATINVKSETGQAIGQMSPSRMAANILQQEGVDPTVVGQIKQKFTRLFGTGALSEGNKKYITDQLNDAETLIRQRVDNNVSAKSQDVNNATGGKLDDAYARKLVSSKWDQFQHQYPAGAKASPEVRSEEDYAKIKSGQQFVYKGKTITKQ